MRKHPLKSIIALCILSVCLSASQLSLAGGLNIPIKRAIATQPITPLEIIAIVKSYLRGRVLSIKKQPDYKNPDCHHVKLLEDKGEFQIIKLGCHNENIEKEQT